MNRHPQGHVLVREELLYSDGHWIHVVGGQGFELSSPDATVLECILRGESEFGLLCSRLVERGIGENEVQVARALHERFTDPRSLLELLPSAWSGQPEVIVCNFGVGSDPAPTRELVRRLRRKHRTLFIGKKENVAGRSEYSLWPERLQGSSPFFNSFRFIQWVRSLIRFHSNAVLVLTGHIDAILFGDLVGTVPTCLILDSSWPSLTPLEDLRGPLGSASDIVPDLRKLFYALRFTGIDDFDRINRLNSSALAMLEEHAIRNADVLLYSSVDQIAELERGGRASARLVPFAPPRRAVSSQERGPRTLVLAANLERGLGPLMPFISLLPPAGPTRPFDEIAVWTAGEWFRVRTKADGTALEKPLAAPQRGLCRLLRLPWTAPQHDQRSPGAHLRHTLPRRPLRP